MLASKNREPRNDQERKKGLHHIILKSWSNNGYKKSIFMRPIYWRWKHDQWQCSARVRITKLGLTNSVPREVICHLNATAYQATTKTAATTTSPEDESLRCNDDLALKVRKQIENWLLWFVIKRLQVENRWSPEFYRLLDALAKIAFITVRIISSFDFVSMV